VDVIERRVAWIAVSDAIVLFFATSGGLAYGLAGLGTWELVERERLVFAALALWALAIVIVVGLVAHGAIEAHQHPNGFGG
jgi:O-antigen ligase